MVLRNVSRSEAFCYNWDVKQIIWVYGTSAAGKETFIRSLIHDLKLRQALQLSDTPRVCYESLKNLGSLDGSRKTVFEEISKLSELHNIVLIKWQYGDTLLNTPNRLQKKFPAIEHKVINLNVNKNEQIRRLKTKPWWRDDGDDERSFILRELRLVDDSIKQLDPAIAITQYNW
jgi:hypothetical protein